MVAEETSGPLHACATLLYSAIRISTMTARQGTSKGNRMGSRWKRTGPPGHPPVGALRFGPPGHTRTSTEGHPHPLGVATRSTAHLLIHRCPLLQCAPYGNATAVRCYSVLLTGMQLLSVASVSPAWRDATPPSGRRVLFVCVQSAQRYNRAQ